MMHPLQERISDLEELAQRLNELSWWTLRDTAEVAELTAPSEYSLWH
jgi:hypothetical protein